MIKNIKITNHLGEELTIDLRSPEKSGFFIRNIHGLGPPNSDVNTTSVLSSDGGFYNSSRVTSRNIVIELGFWNDGSDSIESIRQKTYRFFPMKRNLEIEIETDNRKVFTTGYVESNESNIFSKDQGAVISILCPRAFFYGSDIVQTVFSGITSLFEFPFENPSLTLPLIEFGNVFITTQQTVFYTGDEETGVVIYVNFLGSVNNLAIHNASTGESMVIDSAKVIAITGSDFIAGDLLVISSLRGDKNITLIRSGVLYNLLNALNVNADWFRIDRGDNVFTYTADSGLANMQFLIEHRIVYSGV